MRLGAPQYRLVEEKWTENQSGSNRLSVPLFKTGALYVFMFEAPAAEWEEAWKIGEPIIQKLGLDDEI